MVLDVLGDVPTVLERVGLEAKELLDRVRHERPILDEHPTLIGKVAQQPAGPADQDPRGLVPRGGDDVDVGEELRVARDRKGILHDEHSGSALTWAIGVKLRTGSYGRSL